MSYNYIIVHNNDTQTFEHNLIPNTIITGDLNDISIPVNTGKYLLSVNQRSRSFIPVNEPIIQSYVFTNNILNNHVFTFNNISNCRYFLTVNTFFTKISENDDYPITYIIDNETVAEFYANNYNTLSFNHIVNITNNTLQINLNSLYTQCKYDYFKIILIPC